MTEQSDKPGSIDAQSTPGGEEAADATSAQAAPKPAPLPQDAHKAALRRKRLAAIGVAVLVVLLVFGIPAIVKMLNTVSTDDAYVNGHVTFVAPRVAGQISRVLVDDNYRVRKGDLLAALDREPFQVVVAEKQAAVDTANADLRAAT